MEVIVTLLLCAIAFLLYLLNKSRDEVSDLKEEIYRLRLKQINSTAPPAVDKNTFVRVIFRKDDTKYYDYLLGNVSDVHVGDFVEVYFSSKRSGEPEHTVAKVIYISEPGEVSEFAKSKIKRKSNRRKW